MEAALSGDTDTAVAFLAEWPTPFVQLTAIHIDPATHAKGLIESKSFETAEDARAWIDARQGRANLYFSVNELRAPLNKKAEKTDVARVVALHMDIDAPAGEDPDAFAERVIDAVGSYDLEPGIIIKSGGGVQLFWPLQPSDYIAIDGDEAKAAEAERFTRWLEQDVEQKLGVKPDSVSNVDRIMRLPGTVNLPDDKKIEKGRKPALASVAYPSDVRYPLAAFKQAAPKAANDNAKIKVDWTRVPAYEPAPPGELTPKARIIIAHEGTLKDLSADLVDAGLLKKAYVSWSDVTEAMAGTLKTRGWSPERIASVLMAPLRCNEHVTKKKGTTEKRRAVERAINSSYEAKPSVDNGKWPDGCDDYGVPFNTYGNCLAAIKKLDVECWQDVFRGKPFVDGTKISDDLLGEMSDASISSLRHNIYKQFHFHPQKETMVEAAGVACRARKVDPVLDYYAKLPPWDGVERIEKLYTYYLGAEDNPLNRAMGRKTLCAKVRRAKHPGCKWDHIPVLEGKQGKRKSMFCEDLAIAPDLFTDTSVLAGTAKEQVEVMSGKDVIELGEMAGLHQTTRARIKAFITRKVDRARLAYDRFAADVYRRGICIGTSNPSKYLSDPTGERRWWPVAMTTYRREEFLRDKDQLYAEAVAREPNENLWLDDAELEAAHAALVETRKEANELVDLLADLHGEVFNVAWGKEERISSEAVRKHIGMADVDVLRIKDLGGRIAEAMTICGWTKAEGTIVCIKGATPKRGYRRDVEPGTCDAQAELLPRDEVPF